MGTFMASPCDAGPEYKYPEGNKKSPKQTNKSNLVKVKLYEVR